jgi:hypothetical protein
MSARVIAIDWSGAKSGAHRKIWRADVIDGRLSYLRNGYTGGAVCAQLIELAARHERLIVGLDFAFSMPAWFLRREHVASTPALWEAVADGLGERWLRDCAAPFWGRPRTIRPVDCDPFRRTERDVHRATGFLPKSVFQIGGAGAVGTASIRGMGVLHRLREAGFHVWPYDDPGWPLAIEIYPRIFTGPVRKSNAGARAAFLGGWKALASEDARLAMAASEDAFDAGVSVIEMNRHIDELSSLPRVDDSLLRLEGLVWYPGLARDLLATPSSVFGERTLRA